MTAQLAVDQAQAPQARSLRSRISAFISSAIAAVLGLLPHVLHHAGPLAGAALLAGTAGTLLFGALGLIAAIPFLLHVHKRCGNWRTPGLLLAAFVAIFTISALFIAPVITRSESSSKASSAPTQTQPGGNSLPNGHEGHHD